ncbi:CD48 antigen-like isoform X1 [Sinocyclocheilus anshuiensis]|uniref:CD48 antigen-like isoform X1 n=1 Tax=Sinocyclocheilus anshuiensis TaxID=1608454 RepID=UPI0007BABCAA|nr:PREDICTED: CD48 antigen-like isoform X1 [Sinocyclocheilus anshuiensis]
MSLCGVVLLCIVCILQVSSSEEHIIGYSGQSVVLKSGADSSWNLTRVQWSIYKNTTYIASLKDGEVFIYKFWRHQGRLDLNNETGDLTIRNVTVDDSMTYNVALVTSDGTRKQDKVHLTVRESLKTPDIQKTLHSRNDSRCYVALECIASGQNVNLSWTPDGEFNGSYISGIPNSVDSSLVLFASFSGNRHVTFTCTASSGQQTVTRQMIVGCSEEKQKCEACTVCSSCASSVILSILFTAAVLGFAYAFTRNKESIIAACPEGPLHFIQNISSPGSCGVQGKQDAA